MYTHNTNAVSIVLNIFIQHIDKIIKIPQCKVNLISMTNNCIRQFIHLTRLPLENKGFSAESLNPSMAVTVYYKHYK